MGQWVLQPNQDPDGTYATSDFIVFLNDGTGVISATNQWDGNNWDLSSGSPPETFMSQYSAHPNGTNSIPAEEHWPIRRWESSYTGLADVVWHLSKADVTVPDAIETPNSGVTGILFLNGVEYDRASVGGLDSGGVTRTIAGLSLQNGDLVELALTPAGPSGDRGDYFDLSFTRLTISAIPIPPTAWLFGSGLFGLIGIAKRK